MINKQDPLVKVGNFSHNIYLHIKTCKTTGSYSVAATHDHAHCLKYALLNHEAVSAGLYEAKKHAKQREATVWLQHMTMHIV